MSVALPRRWASVLLGVVLLLPGPSAADPYDRGRTDVGIGVGMARPQGIFRRNVDNAGLTLLFDGGYRLRRGPLAVGGQIEISSYAHETRREPLSRTIPDVQVMVDTNHGIYGGHLWIRAQMPAGTIRPYAMVLAGAHEMSTETSVWGNEEDTEPIASSVDLRDTAWSYGLGGGIQCRLMKERFVMDPETSSDWNVGLLLDLRMLYILGGEARYLPRGGIRTDGGERILDIRRSRTDLTMITLGFVMTIGHPSEDR